MSIERLKNYNLGNRDLGVFIFLLKVELFVVLACLGTAPDPYISRYPIFLAQKLLLTELLILYCQSIAEHN